MSSDGMKPVDQLLWSRPLRSCRKLAWILAEVPRSGSRLKRTQSADCAMQAEETVTNASSSAQTKARGRFMVGLLSESSGKVHPFAQLGRFEITSGEVR